MAAVRAGDIVVQAKRAAGAGGGAFLADRHVRRAAVVVVADRLVGAGPELDDHLFQLADDQHVFEQVERGRRVQTAGAELRAQVACVDKAADRAKRLLERHEIGRCVAPICGLRRHASYL